jgi:branched-chain amino acid transport system ATP-binding protein
MLRIEQVTKTFGGLTALMDVSFDVSAGRIKAVIGPNGAGKTTLFNILSGLMHPDCGSIFFDGADITRNIPEKNARIGIGRTFQITRPFLNMTVLDNVMIGALASSPKIQAGRERANEILELLDMKRLAHLFPGSLTVEDRKRLEVARALALQPRLLLLDEVMAGLNPAEIEAFKKILNGIRAAGTTILLIEHVLHAVLSLSDEIVVLNYGQKIFDGEPKDLVRNEAVIKAYLGTDFM